MWFDIYEVTGIDSELLYGDVQCGSYRIPFGPGKKKSGKSLPRFVWDDTGKMPNISMLFPKDDKQFPDTFINLYMEGGYMGGIII